MTLERILALGVFWPPLSRKSIPVYLATLSLLTCLAPAITAGAEFKLERGVRSVRLVQHEEGSWAVYHVMLDWRFKTAELDTMAVRIRQAAPRTKSTRVLFFLRGMQPDQSAWASSEYNPALSGFEVQINEAATASNPPDPDLQASAGQ